MIRAREQDRAEIEAFLTPRAEVAMFPLNNLFHHGMDDGSDGAHPYSVSMWLSRRDGAIRDVLTRTKGGMVMPVLPSGDYDAAAAVLRGQEIAGVVGARDWARGLLAALRLAGPATMDEDEPQFLLHLADLYLPEGPGRIVPLAEAPEAVIKGWMLDYQLATLHTPADQARQRAEGAFATYVAAQSHVVLMEDGQPLAMTGFNARIPGMVQVGGVYTPPELRGRGHARRALALHLQAEGAARAVLFTSSPAAARAYRAIGFRPIGDWTLHLLREARRA